MKKVLGILTLLGILLSLAGCPNPDKETQRPPGSLSSLRISG